MYLPQRRLDVLVVESIAHLVVIKAVAEGRRSGEGLVEDNIKAGGGEVGGSVGIEYDVF